MNQTENNRLPPYLKERMRTFNSEPIRSNGEFVLYWMHHAVRDHENPAIDAALCMANQLGLPLLVYQGLGGRHPYNSDRHHTFIMEGAREVQQSLHRRGIAYLFYLGQTPHQSTPLKLLVKRAALIITEDFPVPPFTKWVPNLAQKIDTALWVVDCACVVPMRLIPKVYARAYEFRNQTRKEYQKRLSVVFEKIEPNVMMFDEDWEFETIDLATADIAQLCAQCDIDHSVPPVPHTPGGSSAGYERWGQFKRHGLKSYARLRNDAAVSFPQGVSRLSAYIHHGHVSPFRIAREAALEDSAGARKFLDELLIWRELAHNFCFHQKSLETLEALPPWARQTLYKHFNDPREAAYSWETLARAQTGDPLWDATQKSLLIHGELHNNVRMTWGKAFLDWANHPANALKLMIDLNHRFALDGGDPNSFGGLLWCLGLFDRPFKPEKPIIGSLRPRPTQDHARRLNLKAYEEKVKGPAGKKPLHLAVIGAGLSGLTAARTIADHGHHVQVFEKHHTAGGRMATHDIMGYAFDHGAQYFTVRDERFRRYVDSWCEDGLVDRWMGHVAVIRNGKVFEERKPIERWVETPGMNDIPRHLAAGVNISYNVRVSEIQNKIGKWLLMASGGKPLDRFDAVIVSLPPSQAVDLLNPAPDIQAIVGKVKMKPCRAVVAVFDRSLNMPFDAAFFHDSPISWAARNNSKPRRQEVECWVMHATPQRSKTHEAEDELTDQMLVHSFFELTGETPVSPIFTSSKFWRFAQAENPLKKGCIWDSQLKIGVCGDWCQMTRIEGAFLSGSAIAGRVLGLK